MKRTREQNIRGMQALILLITALGTQITLFARNPSFGPRPWADAVWVGLFIAAIIWPTKSRWRIVTGGLLLLVFIPAIVLMHTRHDLATVPMHPIPLLVAFGALIGAILAVLWVRFWRAM
jgi:hypothetical protein